MTTRASVVAPRPSRPGRGATTLPPARRAGARAGTWPAALVPAAILAVAAVLRLALVTRTPRDAFYDAAVRSMGWSWHAFFVGALDPSARVAVDKPPVDLWLQVGSTKLLGFTPLALHLPSALAGAVTVTLLYDLVRTLGGRRAGVSAAAALAVLPVSVITARSDTMDSVMAALCVGALALAARGARTGRTGYVVGAGALVGLAFEVKLFEALLVVVPLAVLWWRAAPLPPLRRAAGLAGAAVAAVAVGLAWLVVVTLAVPAAHRPWAYGSTDGSPWNAAFVYDGLRRLGGGVAAAHPSAAQLQRVPAPPGPLRLLSAQAHLGVRVGVELVAAWIAAGLVAVTGAWRRLDRLGRGGALALVAWLAAGTVVFSLQHDLRPRYLEAFDPAIAACLGGGAALLIADATGRRWRARAAAVGLVGVVAWSALVSAAAAQHGVQDSGSPGAPSAARVATLTAYLRAHQGAARYEAASIGVGEAAAVIAHDGRPVLVLTGAPGRQVVGPQALAAAVAAGQVHTVLVDPACARSAGSCSPDGAWVLRHGTDVSAAAGQPSGVYAVG